MAAKRFDQLGAASKAAVLDLFCRAHGYQDQLPTYVPANTPDPKAPPVMVMVPNPETRQQFAARRCQEWIVEHALRQRAQDQAAAAQSDADLV